MMRITRRLLAGAIIRLQDNMPRLKGTVQMDVSLFAHEWPDATVPKSLTQRQMWVIGVIEEGTGSLTTIDNHDLRFNSLLKEDRC